MLHAPRCVISEETSQYSSADKKTKQHRGIGMSLKSEFHLPIYSPSQRECVPSVYIIWNYLLFLNSGIHILAKFQPPFAMRHLVARQPSVSNSVLKFHVWTCGQSNWYVENRWPEETLNYEWFHILKRIKQTPKKTTHPSYVTSDFHFDVGRVGLRRTGEKVRGKSKVLVSQKRSNKGSHAGVWDGV